MKEAIRKAVRAMVPASVKAGLEERRQEKALREWHRKGCPDPPPHLAKQQVINDYQERFGCSVLVETGTYLGNTVEAQKTRFKQVYSIELGQELCERAKRRFAKDRNVEILQGNSSAVLPALVPRIQERALFWLDGHYSGGITAKGDTDCPVFKELDAILSSRMDHVVLVDDARFFTGQGDYPSVPEVEAHVKGLNADYRVEVGHDIIRCVVPIS